MYDKSFVSISSCESNAIAACSNMVKKETTNVCHDNKSINAI